MLGRIVQEELGWELHGSYLFATHIRERGFNFCKTPGGCEFDVVRHLGAWRAERTGGRVKLIVQHWSADLDKRTMTVTATRKYKKGDYDPY